MALVQATLKTQIEAAFNAQSGKTENPEAAISDLANRLATAIDAYIRSATVTVSAGIPVSTAGSPTAQTGTTTAPGVGQIS